jgi:membrane protein required for colicin V production
MRFVEPALSARPVTMITRSFFFANLTSGTVVGYISRLFNQNCIKICFRYFLNIVFLGWVDRLCGMIFGGIKGILIASVLFIILTTFLPRNSGVLVNSRLSSPVAKVSGAIILFIDNNMKKELRVKLKGIKKQWKKQHKTVQRKV